MEGGDVACIANIVAENGAVFSEDDISESAIVSQNAGPGDAVAKNVSTVFVAQSTEAGDKVTQSRKDSALEVSAGKQKPIGSHKSWMKEFERRTTRNGSNQPLSIDEFVSEFCGDLLNEVAKTEEEKNIVRAKELDVMLNDVVSLTLQCLMEDETRKRIEEDMAGRLFGAGISSLVDAVLQRVVTTVSRQNEAAMLQDLNRKQQHHVVVKLSKEEDQWTGQSLEALEGDFEATIGWEWVPSDEEAEEIKESIAKFDARNRLWMGSRVEKTHVIQVQSLEQEMSDGLQQEDEIAGVCLSPETIDTAANLDNSEREQQKPFLEKKSALNADPMVSGTESSNSSHSEREDMPEFVLPDQHPVHSSASIFTKPIPIVHIPGTRKPRTTADAQTDDTSGAHQHADKDFRQFRVLGHQSLSDTTTTGKDVNKVKGDNPRKKSRMLRIFWRSKHSKKYTGEGNDIDKATTGQKSTREQMEYPQSQIADDREKSEMVPVMAEEKIVLSKEQEAVQMPRKSKKSLASRLSGVFRRGTNVKPNKADR